jgi:oxygen-dependent protoporphyrinogen oxidase
VSSQEETVAEFFTRHLGSEVAQRLVSPFVSGVYAGDVDQLSAKAAFGRVTQLADVGGGIVAGAILSRRQKPKSTPKTAKSSDIPETKSGQLGSFKEGLQQLPSAIVSKLGEKVKFNWELKQITPHPESGYIATFATPEGEQTVEAKTIVLTTPAHMTASLVKDLSPQASQTLEEIPYPPVACVVLAYPDEALRFPLQGFGNLNPRTQGLRTLGTIWSSTLFPGRTPKGWNLLTNFIGGATDPAIAQMGEDEIVEQVNQDLQKAVIQPGSTPKPLAVHLWSKAIPQYNLGHLQRLETIENSLKPYSGLFLSSNYLDGVALGDCVRRGEEMAQSVLAATSVV